MCSDNQRNKVSACKSYTLQVTFIAMDMKETSSQLQSMLNQQEATRDFLKHDLSRFKKQSGSSTHSSKDHSDREQKLWTAEFNVESTKNKISRRI